MGSSIFQYDPCRFSVPSCLNERDFLAFGQKIVFAYALLHIGATVD
jgi:hypothetical protein